MFGVTECTFRDTEWPFRVTECPFRDTEWRFIINIKQNYLKINLTFARVFTKILVTFVATIFKTKR